MLLSFSRSRITIQDILLACLFQTHHHWTEQNTLLVELLLHGRISIFPEMNLLRTVGWINNLVPLVLQAEAISDYRQLIATLKRQIDAIPHRGIGYGICRYLSGLETQNLFRLLPNPEFSLNYQGRRLRQKGLSWIRPAKDQIKHTQSRLRVDTMKIWLKASIDDEILHIQWDYQKHLYRKETINAFANDFLLQLQNIAQSI